MDRRLFRLIVISALMLMARAAAAQTPTASFADVEQILVPGERVIVRLEDGRTAHVRVVAATSDRLEIRRRGLILSPVLNRTQLGLMARLRF
jgi:hypothetical protein